MDNFYKGMLTGIIFGGLVTAVIVAKNRKLAIKIKDGVNLAEEKVCEAKEEFQEKLEECDCMLGESSQNSTSQNKEQLEPIKKSKKNLK